ncbi:bacitracin ABC transporter ATP-binding protein [Candidatus Magnetomorum sp. HK-1]|nr:bacitracin ABC transporter ATP-binding protein [Candidatus Magnetomorum sp. HK-1]
MLDYPELSYSSNGSSSDSIFDYYPDSTQTPVSLLNTTKKFEYLRRQNFGFVFQESYLLNNLTNQINIQIPLFINGLSVQDNHLKKLINEFTLKNEMLSRRPSELSGGEAQRMAVIRAIVHSPKLILADEPTSNIPFKLGLDIFQFFTQWCHQDEERSLIWVTHNIEQAKVYGEHFIHLKDGIVEKQYDKQKAINNVSDKSILELNQDPSWLIFICVRF